MNGTAGWMAVTRRPSRASSTGGPGTLETTALNDAARAAARATAPRGAPGSRSATPASACNGAAAPVALRARIWLATARRTPIGSVSPTGSDTNTNESRLPSAPASPPARRLTGTIALIVAGRSPRRRSARRRGKARRGQEHVVDRRPVAAAGGAGGLHGDRPEGDHAPAGGRAVQRRRRSGCGDLRDRRGQLRAPA